MITYVICCDADSCVNNSKGQCRERAVSIGIRTTGEFKKGERVSFPICEAYKEIKNDDTD